MTCKFFFADAVKERTMFDEENQSCYDFDDDLDELYQLATFLARANPMAILNKVCIHI